MSKTVTLYEYLESEWFKNGGNDFFEGAEFTLENITYFNDEKKFMKKVLQFDDDVKTLLNDKLFMGLELSDTQKDDLFKKTFLQRFVHREINRQTIDAFISQLTYTFLAHQDFLNRIYNDMDQYLLGKNTSSQQQDNHTHTDNRSAYSELPQDNVQLDVNSSIMLSAKDNTISRNKQVGTQQQTTDTTQYSLDGLLKINGLIDTVMNEFDVKCFLQTW